MVSRPHALAGAISRSINSVPNPLLPARLSAQFLGEGTAEDLLQQRARIEQSKDGASCHSGVHRHEVEDAFVGAVGDVEFVPAAVFLLAIGLQGARDEHRAGAQDEVSHISLVMLHKHQAATGTPNTKLET